MAEGITEEVLQARRRYEQLISSLPVWELKYEEIKENPLVNLKKLAGFVGCPFSNEEENKGVPEKITEPCSFRKLSSTEKNSHSYHGVKEHAVNNSSFYRKGQVEDWKNYLTTEMARKLDKITEKLHGSGLTFGKPKAVYI